MSDPGSGHLLQLPEAVRFATELHEAGKRLVVTNGCFDLIHAGHVRYLAAARALGDALLVGLNSDGSAHALKGPGRPIVPQDDRAAVLLALRAVDAVVIFDEPTAGPLLLALRPPLYAKGGDYALGTGRQGTRLPEEPVVRGYGGAIHLIPYLAGHSTSALIARIGGAP
ncbi:MAG TPA: adenylyltransferase/cytidyltransferase family protein [Chloroflexota bacterium]|nr:adenylyltransferase/cytidyltransferase family protein [Chloroflexota bacterium]